eukprot:TRINITY_DN17290_c0_g1_i1.p1 TRINITY_DN17290_c0_g1~~TRINITY_DN17290_c0_g1_i1.p1  ORF type:complete len:281 (+),score=37.45 TRINITY_DN17290_c0_g1_i1:31-873(+)
MSLRTPTARRPSGSSASPASPVSASLFASKKESRWRKIDGGVSAVSPERAATENDKLQAENASLRSRLDRLVSQSEITPPPKDTISPLSGTSPRFHGETSVERELLAEIRTYAQYSDSLRRDYMRLLDEHQAERQYRQRLEEEVQAGRKEIASLLVYKETAELLSARVEQQRRLESSLVEELDACKRQLLDLRCEVERLIAEPGRSSPCNCKLRVSSGEGQSGPPLSPGGLILRCHGVEQLPATVWDDISVALISGKAVVLDVTASSSQVAVVPNVEGKP